MNVTIERLPESQILLQIEIEPERLQGAMDKAYRRLAPRARVPGFRPGKAPRAMVERYLGRETLLHDALDRLIPEAYDEAIAQTGIEPVGQPELDLAGLEPVVIKAVVPVRPTVDLGDYRSIRVEQEPETVDDQTIEQTIEQLRRRYATVAPVERPVQQGDFLRADVQAVADGEEIFDHKDVEFRADPEQSRFFPALAERLIGMADGETREITVDVPEDAANSRLAGKQVTYTVTLREIKEEELPELNDEFALMVGEGFPTMDALREHLRTDARKRAEDEAKRRYEQKVLDALVAGATMEFPPLLADREAKRLLDSQLGDGADQRQAMHRYLAQIGKSEDDLRRELLPVASERVARSLALSQLTDDEGLSVTAEEIEAEIERIATDSGAEADKIRAVFADQSGHSLIENQLLTRKTYERLTDIAMGRPLPERSAAAPEAIAAPEAHATAEPEGSEAGSVAVVGGVAEGV